MLPMFCAMCGLQYALPDDFQEHQRRHLEAAASYDKTMKQYQEAKSVVWSGRPKLEDPGTYLALNTLNLRMLGFTSIIGLDEVDLRAFQAGGGEVVPEVARGDGHDRGGLWITSDGRIFRYNANWRAGMADFSPYSPK